MTLHWVNDACPPYSLHHLPSDGWFVAISGAGSSSWSPFLPTKAAAQEWAELREEGLATARALQEATKC